MYLDLALDGKTGGLYGASNNNPEGGSFFKIDTASHEVTRLNPPGTVGKYCIFGTTTPLSVSLASLSLFSSLSFALPLFSSPLSLALSLSLSFFTLSLSSSVFHTPRTGCFDPIRWVDTRAGTLSYAFLRVVYTLDLQTLTVTEKELTGNGLSSTSQKT